MKGPLFFSRSRLNTFTTTIAMMVVCFFLGYVTGMHPHWSVGKWIWGDHKVIILTSKADLFPLEFLMYLKRRALVDIEIKIPQSEQEWQTWMWKSDILITEEPKLIEAQEILGKGPLHRWFTKKTEKLVSPDFIRNDFSQNATLPLFWKATGNSLEILHIWVPPHGPQNPNASARLIEQLTDRDVQLIWLQKTTWNTTQLTLDTADIDPNRKSTALRRFDFKKLIE